MNKTILYQLLALLLLFGITTTANAQVTIGSNKPPEGFSVLELDNKDKTDKGGLRLPHLTTGKRNALSAMQAFLDEQHRKDGTANPPKEAGLALGLTIYNTDTNCMEYWSGYKWVSLCLGIASIEVGNYPQTNPIPPGGGETLPMIPNEVPKCTSNPPYSIAVAVGAAYANAYIIEQSTGEFKVYMNDNPTAKGRTAIVRLTNNCTGEYKEFVFNQEGNAGLCDQLTDKPVLTASNSDSEGGVICGDMGNSIILAVSNPALKTDGTPATYIWMRNDNEEIGRGKSITVSQAGSYKVYAGGISCGGNDFSDPIDVTVKSGSTAPSALTIVANNGGVVCDGAAVILTVKDYSAITVGTVIWYKDGVEYGAEDVTGKTASATTAGKYLAVLSESGCMSNPSNAVDVTVQAGTKVTFTKADIEINSKTLDLGDPSFCSGGWLNMKIVNVEIGYIYKWIVNGVQVGTGTTCDYQLPGDANTDVNLSIVAESGAAKSCPNAITIGATMSVNVPLNAAIIGSKLFCNNTPGGAQLSAVGVGEGATYIWKNLNTNVTSNTGTTNVFGAKASGRYEVEITTKARCKSVTPVPHEVEMIGSPALTWSGGVLASIVGENETVTFVVKNVGSPVTQGYTWTAANKNGNAGATIPAGTTGGTANLTFTGGGVVTLTIVGKGFCGNSAPLIVDVTVNQDKPSVPVIVTPQVVSVCAGWDFSIEEGDANTPGTLKYYEDQYGTNGFKITWYTAGNSVGTGTPIASGVRGEFSYVSFTQNGAKAMMTATCTAGGRESDLSAVRTAIGGIGSVQSHSVKGETCFDVKQTEYTNNDYGVWAQRKEANFGIMYEYDLLGTLLPKNVSDVKWRIDDEGSHLVESTDYTTLNKARIKFKDVKQYPNIKGSSTGESVILHVGFTVDDKGCLASYKESIVITIKDADCCGSVADSEGNVYYAARFGDAGCWMTENLNVTKNPAGATIGYAIPNGNVTNAKPKANGGASYGRHYTWQVATNNETVSPLRGICPEGWVLPSDKDWNMLEKEIATNPTAYSEQTIPLTWILAWETVNGSWRPDSSGANNWGRSMKNKATANGVSFTSDKGGFDALLVGHNGSVTSTTDFWSSSAYSTTSAWTRHLSSGYTGVIRYSNTKTYQFSVRCKKKVN